VFKRDVGRNLGLYAFLDDSSAEARVVVIKNDGLTRGDSALRCLKGYCEVFITSGFNSAGTVLLSIAYLGGARKGETGGGTGDPVSLSGE